VPRRARIPNLDARKQAASGGRFAGFQSKSARPKAHTLGFKARKQAACCGLFAS